MDTVITTYLAGNCAKGTLCCLYVFAQNRDGEFWHSDYHYSTPEGARLAARRRSFNPRKGVAQGHNEARRRLGLPLIDYSWDARKARGEV